MIQSLLSEAATVIPGARAAGERAGLAAGERRSDAQRVVATGVMSASTSKEVAMKLTPLVFLLLFAALMLSACGRYHHMGHPHGSSATAVERATEEVASLIDRTVQDTGKAEQAKSLLRQIVAEARQSRQQNRQFHQALYELNADYNTEPEAFLKIIDEMNLRRMQTAGKILRLRFDMKGLMTEKEWKAFTDGMSDMRGRYQPEAEGKS